MLILALLTAALAIADGPDTDPRHAAMVTVGFRDRPIGEILRALASQSGNAVEVGPMGLDPNAPPPIATLAADEPLPFWEALDRLAASTGQAYQLAPTTGMTRRRGAVLVLGGAQGRPRIVKAAEPARYVGPFRIGPLTLHAHYRREFLAEPTAAVPEPLLAEFPLLVEPRIVALQTAPARATEAADDLGQSLVPEAAVAAPFVPGLVDFEKPVVIRVPLRRPEGQGERLKSLRGVVPVELAIRSAEPAQVVPLDDLLKGRELRAGDLVVRVEEANPKPANPNLPTRFRLVLAIDGPRGDGAGGGPAAALRDARLMVASRRLLEFTDANGREGVPTTLRTQLMGESGTLSLTLEFRGPAVAANPAAAGRPTELRLYQADWVAWELPFAFDAMPLP